MAVATGREYGLFINGELVEPQSGELRDLSEPATGEALAGVAMAGEADIDRAVDAARAALDGAWGKTPATERSRLEDAVVQGPLGGREVDAPGVRLADGKVPDVASPGREGGR